MFEFFLRHASLLGSFGERALQELATSFYSVRSANEPYTMLNLFIFLFTNDVKSHPSDVDTLITHRLSFFLNRESNCNLSARSGNEPYVSFDVECDPRSRHKHYIL